MAAPLNPSGFTTPATPNNSCAGNYLIDVLAHQPAGFFVKQMLDSNPFEGSWWANRVSLTAYPSGGGPSPQRRVQSRQRGRSQVPGRLWTPSNGDGSANANIAAGQPIGTPSHNTLCIPLMPLNRGYLNRGMNEFHWGSNSRSFAAEDFNRSLDPEQDLTLEFQGYGEQIVNQRARFQAREYVRLCKYKVYAKPNPGGMFGRHVTNTIGDASKMEGAEVYARFLDGIIPTPTDPVTGVVGAIGDNAAYLGLDTTIKPESIWTQELGSKIVQFLMMDGAPGISKTNNATNYEFVTDLLTSEAQLRDQTVGNVATAFNYADMGMGSNAHALQGLGQMLTFRNHVNIVDQYSMALDANYNDISPFITIQVDSGTEDVINPAWLNAPYRVSLYYSDDVFNVAYPPTASSPGGNITFQPYSYMGDLKFVLFDRSIAPLQDAGYFYSKISAVSWAAQQRHGIVVIHLGCSCSTNVDCAGILTTQCY